MAKGIIHLKRFACIDLFVYFHFSSWFPTLPKMPIMAGFSPCFLSTETVTMFICTTKSTYGLYLGDGHVPNMFVYWSIPVHMAFVSILIYTCTTLFLLLFPWRFKMLPVVRVCSVIIFRMGGTQNIVLIRITKQTRAVSI